MSVTVIHPEYEARLDEWERIQAVFAGRDTVIAAGELFVPILGGQTPQQYRDFLLRGLWYGATDRTRKGIVGLVFSQEPQVAVSPGLEKLLDDITLTDVALEEFCKEVFSETIAYNWGGILVDVPAIDELMNPADLRPYLSFYHATNVRWWRQERIGGKMVTTRVILRETQERPLPSEEFGSAFVDIYRVLRLDLVFDPVLQRSYWQYSQEQWEEVQESNPNNPFNPEKHWQRTKVIIPKRKDQPIDFIPFTFMTTNGNSPHIQKSELLDMVDLNLDHWRLSIDLRHGLHFTALPTPCASAIPDGLDLKIGSESAWTSTDANFKSWYLEFSGAGIGALNDAIERDEHLMSLIGSRLLETQKRAAETAEAMIIRQAGEDSIVMSAARSVEDGIEKALWQMGWWMGEENPKVSVSLTRALNDLSMTTQDLIVIMKAYQANLISEQTFLEALIRKQYIRGRDWQEEADLVKNQIPPAPILQGPALMDRNTVTTGLGVTNDKNFQPTTG